MAFGVTSFDALNQLVGMKRSEPFKEFYAPMHLTKEQKRERQRLAEAFEEEFLYMMSYMFYAYPTLNEQMIYDLRDAYIRAIEEVGLYSMVDQYYRQAEKFAIDCIEATQRHKEDPYYYSADRARFCAENESNKIWAYTEYEEAVGNCQYKQWQTIIDGKERDSHAEINGEILRIGEPFILAGGLMMFPTDDSMGASDEEIVNCRCSLTFF